jgi:hypothetical protein
MDEWSFWARFTCAGLATWRLAHLLAEEDGPADLVLRLRARLGTSLAGDAMDCIHCMALWIAAPMAFAVADDVAGWLLAWLAIAGGASLAARLTERGTPNHQETEDALLWTGPGAARPQPDPRR